MPRTQRTGNSCEVVLPASRLARADLSASDHLVVAPLPDGVLLASDASATGRMVAAMLEGMDRYGETYRALASERFSD